MKTVAVEVGQQAPDVRLVNSDRKAVKLNEFYGTPLVLAFFPGAFTGTCTKEMCAFRDSLAQFSTLNARVVGISVDSPYAQKAFADANGLNFPLLSDFNREAVRAFGIEDPNWAGGLMPGVAMRSVFVLDQDGVVRFRWIAPTQGTEPDYAAVEAAVKTLGR
ncbi:MAG: peroxiredoxin [Armatimonadota bacterium]|nr:peroxiredoxin [Armatimonadota bacterium]